MLALAGLTPSAPAQETRSEDESALDAGEILIRGEERGAGGLIVATAHCAAPPAIVLDEVMNLEARVAENRSLRGVEIYLREHTPQRVGARWELSVFGFSVVFHVLYTCRRDADTCSYRLDPDRPNDVEASEGEYRVEPRGSGTRLVYTSRTDAGPAFPRWLRRWIAGRSLRQQVEGIRKRAEARAASG
ncbi:MAG: SRPBCC family protein [Myxococcota bacterium]|nr:SRPBCC family protein [Myxococcota bacterium]